MTSNLFHYIVPHGDLWKPSVGQIIAGKDGDSVLMLWVTEGILSILYTPQYHNSVKGDSR